MHGLRLLALVLVVFAIVPFAPLERAHAAPAPRAPSAASSERIPDALRPWIPWVLEDADEEACPLVAELRTCVWPTTLELAATNTGATFTMRVTVDAERLVALPGSSEQWPEDVRLDAQPAAVVEPQNLPHVLVRPGVHVITGRFAWPALPDSLTTPANLGTLVLSLNGARVPLPKREASGLVWLRSGGARDGEAERLELSVHRRIEDGVPLRIVTRIHVSASGTSREVRLPSVLVPGSRPISLHAELPAQLALDGTLRMQAQAGTYVIEIVSVRDTPTGSLRAPALPAPWPEREIWVWRADDRLRHAELGGAPQIDPARTDLDADWHGLPTYVLGPGDSLTIATKRRGEPEPPPNQLALMRTLWLDLDGDGYTVRDQLSGNMSRGFRIDLEQGSLGHAVVSNADELVTLHDKKPGIELRRGEVQVTTEWRLEHGRGDLPAVGYSEDVQALSTTLNLPPGFALLGVRGADHVPGTWIDGWDLWDFFFVLLMSLAVAKLAGLGFGAVALVTLVLTHHEGDAPMLAWIFLLASTALVQVAKPATRFESFARFAWLVSLAGLLIVLVPFAVMQARAALYPQLAQAGVTPTPYSNLVFEQQAARAPAMAPSAPASEAPSAEAETADAAGAPAKEESKDYERVAQASGSLTSTRAKHAYDKSEVDPSVVVQTGPGVPTWSFRGFSVEWSGPVARAERLSLWIAPPPLTRAWSLLNVLLSGALLFALARAARTRKEPPESGAVTAAATFVLAGLLAAPSAHAQSFPPPELLDGLRTRLIEPPPCSEGCLSVSKLSLAVQDNRLVLRAEVHAAAKGAYVAPGPLDNWAPDSMRMDGKDAVAATRLDGGHLHVRVDPGLHVIELSGPLPKGSALTLALGTPPHHVEARAEGWTIEGLRPDGRAEGALVLRRNVADGAPQVDEGESQLAQWLEVRRELDLGVRFRVTTTVSRLGPAGENVLVRLPLLPSEAITEAGLNSDGKSVVVELRRDQTSVTFASTLRVSEQIALHAALPTDAPNGPVVRPWNESWIVRCSTLYRCELDGLAPVSRLGPDGMLAYSFRPWPGESLAVRATRLDAAKGASVTVDSVERVLTPGSRMESSSLTLRMRTSRGTTERITLPPQATLRTLRVDGAERPARLQKGSLEVTLGPGAHELTIDLQEPRGMRFDYTSSPMRVSRPLVNVITSVNVPRDRWLLWADGPAWGPAVLFWGYLVVVLLAAAGLGRAPHSPLQTHEWVLLGLGLTQVDVTVSLIIVGWLFVLAWRERALVERRRLFNFVQVLIVMLTLAALSCLAYTVHQGLVVQPDMQVQGADSSNEVLRWLVDRTTGALPDVRVFSVPLWIYKALMLAWALWLAASLLRWLRWGFRAYRSGGAWRPKPPRVRVPPRVPEPPPEPPAAPTVPASPEA